MNLPETTYERIEAFLQGDLPAEEAEVVRRQMEGDPDFAVQVEWMRDFLGLMQDERSRDVLETFRKTHQERQRKEDRLYRLKITLAVVVAVLLAFLLFLFLTGRDGEPTQEIPVIEEKLSPEEEPDGSNEPIAWQELIEYKSGLSPLGAEENESLQEARRLLSEGRRRAALPYLEAYLSSLPPGEDDFSLRLETGKIYLGETDNTTQAAFHFNEVLQSDALLPYREEARYYLALTALARDDKAAAAAMLRSLAEEASEPVWQEKALQTLEALE